MGIPKEDTLIYLKEKPSPVQLGDGFSTFFLRPTFFKQVCKSHWSKNIGVIIDISLISC